MSTWCSKHVEAWNKLIVIQKFCASSWLITEINILRRTVTWTSLYHDARSPERHYITMHGHLNVTISRCTVTWTSLYHDARSPERHYITMHGHLNVTISRCKVIWTSLYHDARSPERHYITIRGYLNVTISRCTVTWTSLCHDARSPECQIRETCFVFVRNEFLITTDINFRLQTDNHTKQKVKVMPLKARCCPEGG